jgi:hypothetical protein
MKTKTAGQQAGKPAGVSAPACRPAGLPTCLNLPPEPDPKPTPLTGVGKPVHADHFGNGGETSQSLATDAKEATE